MNVKNWYKGKNTEILIKAVNATALLEGTINEVRVLGPQEAVRRMISKNG